MASRAASGEIANPQPDGNSQSGAVSPIDPFRWRSEHIPLFSWRPYVDQNKTHVFQSLDTWIDMSESGSEICTFEAVGGLSQQYWDEHVSDYTSQVFRGYNWDFSFANLIT